MSHSPRTRCPRRHALVAGLLSIAASTLTAAAGYAAPPPGLYDPRVEYRVNVATDAADARVGDAVCRTNAGTCTLRAALQEAANDRAASTIRFDLGKQAINVRSALPAIRDFAGPTIVDGGGSPYTVEVRGPGTTSAVNGLVVTSPGNTVQNLSIYNFRNQIRVSGWNNRITGNIIGTNRDATFAAPVADPLADDTAGLLLDGDAANNVIDENTISGNGDIGVLLRGAASANTIARNDIGLSQSGVRPNGSHGVVVGTGNRFNTVGGDRTAGNAIAGNRGSGVQVAGILNRVSGNTIGLRSDSAAAPPIIAPNADTNVVVGPSAETRVSDNLMIGAPDGVVIGVPDDGRVADGGISGARVTSNEIGRSASGGSLSDPTGETGVTVWQGSHTVLAYNAVRRQEVGFRIAENLPTPVLQIGNVFESG